MNLITKKTQPSVDLVFQPSYMTQDRIRIFQICTTKYCCGSHRYSKRQKHTLVLCIEKIIFLFNAQSPNPKMILVLFLESNSRHESIHALVIFSTIQKRCHHPKKLRKTTKTINLYRPMNPPTLLDLPARYITR